MSRWPPWKKVRFPYLKPQWIVACATALESLIWNPLRMVLSHPLVWIAMPVRMVNTQKHWVPSRLLTLMHTRRPRKTDCAWSAILRAVSHFNASTKK